MTIGALFDWSFSASLENGEWRFIGSTSLDKQRSTHHSSAQDSLKQVEESIIKMILDLFQKVYFE